MIDPLISTQRLFLGLLSMQKKFNGDKKRNSKKIAKAREVECP